MTKGSDRKGGRRKRRCGRNGTTMTRVGNVVRGLSPVGRYVYVSPRTSPSQDP